MKRIFKMWAVSLAVLSGAWQSAEAFHPSVYTPRVPLNELERIQEIESPFNTTAERIAKGREIYFGKGLCVTCHSNNGKGVKLPGHSRAISPILNGRKRVRMASSCGY